ncbi:OLC1v1003584C1 [Oldenlandia corymbosa var. corymbosa]|uniref:OLC1v1003584C1 n=1 Tax=Oldenlandia corymbosa var. corymbosa TaxID=529605 RepID=A0AAV1DCR8_OLDCO|nr:OLC1v1003584C1 [Oldenlandia corymbosa var. corymbosa]
MAVCFSFSHRRAAASVCLFTLLWAAAAESFQCNSTGVTCSALVDYASPNATTLAAIQSLFNLPAFTSLLAANRFSPSTPTTQNVSPGQTLKIPFPCICANGTGVSNRIPVYTVVHGDSLYHIAAEVFSGLVTYQDIQRVNGIPDANKIEPGQKLWVPLPCSCGDVDGHKVVHYGYLVPNGSTVDGIANQFGTTPDTLSTLNGLAGPNDLEAGAIIDVPLRACDSMISNNSVDYPLLVPNGSYALTANDCVKCDCASANNWMLQCSPSQMKPTPNNTWRSCPSMNCQQGLLLGNTSSSSCNTCAYAGYSNQSIFTTTAPISTCSGSMELASTGVSITVFNTLSDLFNIPLLGVATSFLAEDIPKITEQVSVTGLQGIFRGIKKLHYIV